MQTEVETLELRLTEINLQLAKASAARIKQKGEWVGRGVDTPITERVAQENLLADLNVQKCETTLALRQAQASWRAGKRTTRYHVLVKLLNERGLGTLLDEVNALVDGQHA